MIGVIDYGLGNVAAFLTVYEKLNIQALAVSHANQFLEIEKIILPGVGAFDEAMGLLQDSGLAPSLDIFVCEQKKPILGVCVGMQMMAKSSEEGTLPGLGWLQATVRRFPENVGLRVPHIGWNDVSPRGEQELFQSMDNPQFYFLHSYYFDAEDPSIIAAESHYGSEFACAVRKDNIYGTQFHPEKSHAWGVGLLKNFAQIQN